MCYCFLRPMRKHLTRSSYITYYFGRLYTSFTLSLYPSHPLPLIKKQSTGRNYDVGLSNRYFTNLRAKTVLDLPTS